MKSLKENNKKEIKDRSTNRISNIKIRVIFKREEVIVEASEVEIKEALEEEIEVEAVASEEAIEVEAVASEEAIEVEAAASEEAIEVEIEAEIEAEDDFKIIFILNISNIKIL